MIKLNVTKHWEKTGEKLGLSFIQTDARSISIENPNKYIVITSAFGLYALVLDRLSIHSPGDSKFNWYALNGKIKKFTRAQKIAEQNACIGRD